MEAAAVEAVDLTTYEGEDPCLGLEPICLNCRAKQSEKQLTLCSGCSVVWYCSNACKGAAFEWHRRDCEEVSRNKARMEAAAQELHEQYQVEDPYVSKRSIPWSARDTHQELYHSMDDVSSTVHKIANQGDTKELWEMVLENRQRAFRMQNRSSLMDDDNASNIAFTLISLGRMEDAWRFIRNTMVASKRSERSQVMIEYDPQDRYTDCLEWVCSSYPLTTSYSNYYERRREENFCYLVMGLIVIKLRIRVAASRDAWKETIKVFLQTKQGRNLDEVRSVLEEYFSLSDDAAQLEQIRQLMSIIHSSDATFLGDHLGTAGRRESRLYDFRDRSQAYDNTLTCLRRTPNGHKVLSAELNSQSFGDRCTKLRESTRAAKDIQSERRNYVLAGTFYTGLVTFARYVLIIPHSGIARGIGKSIIILYLVISPGYFQGLLLCTAGALVGFERWWNMLYFRMWLATWFTLSFVVRTFKLRKTFMVTYSDGVPISYQVKYGDFFTQGLIFSIDGILPLCLISLVLWWKVVPIIYVRVRGHYKG